MDDNHPKVDPEQAEEWEELNKGIKILEENWFKKASVLNSYLISPVHDAAAKGNVDNLSQLIASGVDINSVDATMNTPLHWASGAGHLPAVKWLLEHNADMKKQNLLGDTALHRAVWRSQANVVQALVDAGIDMSIQNKSGQKAIELVRGNIQIGAILQSCDIEYQQAFADQIGLLYDEKGNLGDYDISDDSDNDNNSEESE